MKTGRNEQTWSANQVSSQCDRFVWTIGNIYSADKLIVIFVNFLEYDTFSFNFECWTCQIELMFRKINVNLSASNHSQPLHQVLSQLHYPWNQYSMLFERIMCFSLTIRTLFICFRYTDYGKFWFFDSICHSIFMHLISIKSDIMFTYDEMIIYLRASSFVIMWITEHDTTTWTRRRNKCVFFVCSTCQSKWLTVRCTLCLLDILSVFSVVINFVACSSIFKISL